MEQTNEPRPIISRSALAGVRLPAHYCPYCFQHVGWLGRMFPRWLHSCKAVSLKMPDSPKNARGEHDAT
jgi:hypothetical protein